MNAAMVGPAPGLRLALQVASGVVDIMLMPWSRLVRPVAGSAYSHADNALPCFPEEWQNGRARRRSQQELLTWACVLISLQASICYIKMFVKLDCRPADGVSLHQCYIVVEMLRPCP